MFLFFYIKIDVNEEFLHPHQKLYNQKEQSDCYLAALFYSFQENQFKNKTCLVRIKCYLSAKFKALLKS